MIPQTISLASDHAGVIYKAKIKDFLSNTYPEIKVVDHGPFTEDSVDYPDYAHPLAKSISNGISEMGIILCGSGNGVCMTVNKYEAVRGALCWDVELSELARLHNNANVLCLPARFISFEKALEIVNIFLNTEFEGGRHQKRTDKIKPV